jgi:hypothetical protein
MDILTFSLLLFASAVTEFFIYVPLIWKHLPIRQLMVMGCVALITFATVGFVASHPSVFSVLLAILSLYRLFNLCRMVEQRMNDHYLKNVTFRTFLVLSVMQLLLWCGDYALRHNILTWHDALTVLVVAQGAATLVLLHSTIRTLNRTRIVEPTENLATSGLPTVTVAIPARNETEDLEECLSSLLANDYPKLEILVLDDCSQLRRTPEIIRSFAHDGVRFLKGEEPRDNWLAKNQAYDKLAQEANGEIILFCGVDIRFEPYSIKQLVAQLSTRKKRMISVLPLRTSSFNQHSFVQAARYFWELVPPRRLFNRPPVLSSCWLIYRKDLKALGGFAAVSRKVIPEAHFANELIKKDSYAFLRASQEASVQSVKSYAEQRSTAIRTRYPQLHRRPENVLLFSLAGITCFLLPVIVLISALLTHVASWVALASLMSFLVLTVINYLVTVPTRVNSWYVALWSFVPIVLTDLWLMHVSMVKYEFSEVIWKDRNVCVPVMHVIPSLPKLPN